MLLSDVWPVAAGVVAGPGTFIAIYRWVVSSLLKNISVLTQQRDAAIKRADDLQLANDALETKLDAEQTRRRAAEEATAQVNIDKLALVAANARLTAEVARLGGTP